MRNSHCFLQGYLRSGLRKHRLITRTWTATDACGNSATASQTITIEDNTALTLILPLDATVECNQSTDPTVTGMATATDVCGTVTVSYTDAFAQACGNTGVITRTWTATDACGNSASASQTINVVNQTPPTIAGVPADKTVQCDAVPNPASPTATDVCDVAPVISFVETSTQTNDGSCTDYSYTITRTWTATDACGNSALASQTITIEDNTAPTLILPLDATVECNQSTDPTVTGMATATDVCGTVTVSYTDAFAQACGNTGVITRTWTATDACGNSASASQTINVVDQTPPTIAGVPADKTVQCDAVPNPASPTATDVCDVAPVISFVETSTQTNDGSCTDYSYTITRTWTATDACGNSTSASQTINVVDQTPPTIAGVPADKTVQCDAVPNPASPTATDVCDVAPVISFVETSTQTNDGSCTDYSYTITRTWTATDACGNSTSASQTINVVDQTPPNVITKNIIVQLNASGKASIAENTVDNGSSDACGSITFDTNITNFDCSSVGDNTVILTVTDACGNTQTGTANVTVEDNIAPTVLTQNISIYLDQTGDTTITASDIDNGSSDACGIASLTVSPNTFTCTDVGTNTVTLTVTDVNGNSSNATANVTIMLRPTSLTITGDLSGQYSDQVNLSATLIDDLTGHGIADSTIQFQVGTQTISAVTDADGIASTTLILNQAPAQVDYSASFTESCPYAASSDNQPFTILPEDACYEYTGPEFAATTNIKDGTVTLLLTATVFESTDGDGSPGEISNATVQFFDITNDGHDSISKKLTPVPDPNNPSIGYVSCEHEFDIGNSDADNFEIALEINGNYTINPDISCTDETVINIYTA